MVKKKLLLKKKDTESVTSNKRSHAHPLHFTSTLTFSPTEFMNSHKIFRNRPSPDLSLASFPKAGYTVQGNKMRVWATKKEADSKVYPEQKPL